MNILKNIGAGIILAGSISFNVWAGNVTIPNTFTSNTTALATEVNANFSAIETAVDDNDSRTTANAATISTLQTAVATLQTDLATANSNISTLQTDLTAAINRITVLEANSVSGLGSVLTIDTDNGYSRALFSGVNVQVVNGVAQGTADGTGNLIVGYNNARTGTAVCSDGQYTDQTACESNGETWASSHKSGSHNLVAGDKNSYSQTGGIVVGESNAINRNYTSINGGQANIASGLYSSINGGVLNTIQAAGQQSNIGGGFSNNVSGIASTISGGSINTVTGDDSSISGGTLNTASGVFSSVSGGYTNTASGDYSSVSGGNTHDAAGIDDWRAGSLWEDQ